MGKAHLAPVLWDHLPFDVSRFGKVGIRENFTQNCDDSVLAELVRPTFVVRLMFGRAWWDFVLLSFKNLVVGGS